MNIYLLVEDGVSSCVRAKTMTEAVGVCEKLHLKFREEEVDIDFDEDGEREYYHEKILESCTLIGELIN